MPMPTPRKQTLVITVVCAVAVIATALYVYGKSSSNGSSTKEEPSVIAQAMSIPIDASTIGTSTDWKQEFFNGNSAQPGAGIFGTSSVSAGASSSSEQLTATQQFGRDFFSKYVDLQQLNLVDNPDVVSSTMSSIIAQDYSSGSDGPKVYTESDITVGPSDSVANLKAYGNALGSLLQTYTPQKDDASIALAGMEGKDPSYVNELKDNVSRYNVILKSMLSMPVPPSLESYHLGLINGGSSMIFISTAFQAAETDPLRSINAMRIYQTAFSQVIGSILSIRITLAQAGISYASTEGGSFFFRGTYQPAPANAQ